MCRRARCDALLQTRKALDRYCTTLLQQLRLKFARYEQHTMTSVATLDQQLLTLVLHYYATLEKEMELHTRRVRDEER